MLTTKPLFDLNSFDWRAIAAGHPASCACQCCNRARSELSIENARRIDSLAGDYRALLSEKMPR